MGWQFVWIWNQILESWVGLREFPGRVDYTEKAPPPCGQRLSMVAQRGLLAHESPLLVHLLAVLSSLAVSQTQLRQPSKTD